MKWIDETVMQANLDDGLAFEAAKQVFLSIANTDAEAFDSVRNAIGHKDALFGNKSGFDKASMALGLKAGGYWRHNERSGLPNHQSVTLLFNPDTGQPIAAASGNHLTAMRTAAAAAVSIDCLARSDARTLGVIGAGVQAEYHIRAALRQRDFTTVNIWNRTRERAEALANRLADLPIKVVAVDLEEAVSQSDVLITVVSAFAPIVPAELVKAGAHIAAMGTDTIGKQELDASLFANAIVFTDELRQSVELGEAQHAIKAGLITPDDITPISEVVIGRHSGRNRASDITIYDGTGLGLQDLITTKLVLAAMGETA